MYNPLDELFLGTVVLMLLSVLLIVLIAISALVLAEKIIKLGRRIFGWTVRAIDYSIRTDVKDVFSSTFPVINIKHCIRLVVLVILLCILGALMWSMRTDASPEQIECPTELRWDNSWDNSIYI